jgi:tetratricopeptide (TPR) repeat protein
MLVPQRGFQMFEKRWAKLLPSARLPICAAATLSLLGGMMVSADTRSHQKVTAESGMGMSAGAGAGAAIGIGAGVKIAAGTGTAGAAGATGTTSATAGQSSEKTDSAPAAAGTSGAGAAVGPNGAGDATRTPPEGAEGSDDQKAQAKPAIDINRQLRAAGDCMVDGRYADAADVYKQALSISPDSVEALAGLGMALGRQNKLDEADEQFDHVLTLDAKNPVAHCGKAMVLLNRFTNGKDTSGKTRAQLLKDAGRECNKALDADPRVVEAHYLLGKVYREENRLDRAELAFGGAVKLDPHYGSAWVALGSVQTQREKFGAALESFNQAISVSPNNAKAYFGRGQLYARQGQTERAVKEYNMSLYKNSNDAAVHLALGKAFDQQGDSVAAVKEFTEAIKLKPDDPEAYVDLASNLENRGELDTAIGKLRNGLKVMPNEPSLRILIGNANLRAARLDEAIADFQAVLGTSPKSVEAAQGLVRAIYVKAQTQVGGGERSGDNVRMKPLVAMVADGNPDSLTMRYVTAELAAIGGDMPNLETLGVPKTDAERLALAEANLAENKFQEADDLFKRVTYSALKAKDAFAIADLAYSLRAMDAAEAAFRKGITFVNSEARARKGLEACTTARQLASADFVQAEDMTRRHLYDQAAAKYRSAVFGDPRNAEAHLGLAQCLERITSGQSAGSAKIYRDAITQYRLYLRLAPGVPARVADKCNRKIAHLDELARKYEGSGSPAARSASGRPSSDRVSSRP